MPVLVLMPTLRSALKIRLAKVCLPLSLPQIGRKHGLALEWGEAVCEPSLGKDTNECLQLKKKLLVMGAECLFDKRGHVYGPF